jgi:DNA-binding XRE family transcriptional regulator
MSDGVILLAGHALALARREDAARSAKNSKEILGLPLLEASLTTAPQCHEGMPRVRQPLTTEGSCRSSATTSPVPPRSSMIESQVVVDADLAIRRNIVRTARTCQVFANGETTIRVLHGEIPPMDTDKDISGRLIAVRKRFGLNQAQFAEAIGLAKNVYNPFEKASRPLTLDAARRIRRRFGISIDWLYFGDVGQPSEGIARELGPNPGAVEAAKGKRA